MVDEGSVMRGDDNAGDESGRASVVIVVNLMLIRTNCLTIIATIH